MFNLAWTYKTGSAIHPSTWNTATTGIPGTIWANKRSIIGAGRKDLIAITAEEARWTIDENTKLAVDVDVAVAIATTLYCAAHAHAVIDLFLSMCINEFTSVLQSATHNAGESAVASAARSIEFKLCVTLDLFGTRKLGHLDNIFGNCRYIFRGELEVKMVLQRSFLDDHDQELSADRFEMASHTVAIINKRPCQLQNDDSFTCTEIVKAKC